ncbi:serine/threonine protein kinase [Pseudonocardia oceani]|uniref:non-specific serine/threonine protein kinase n=7 Tax=Pseudonocardia oceani TaxID=2792013 RepID=A0ABS6U4Q7_9PSEU|nr:serine/threonine protein kinase [Pseudonocardia oceani]
MGEVHRAYHVAQDRTVALKLLHADIGEDEEYRRRFLRESRVTARLTDPHVIPIHNWGEIDGRLYLDMRLVEGEDLSELLGRSGRLPPARTVALVSQVARALDSAHRSGLVHRDVKPSNVLLAANEDGHDFAYLVDFGIARSLTGDTTGAGITRAGTAVGTLDYMAPERFLEQPVDGRTDVYALACVLYECLTGEKPFPVQGLPALMRGHLRTPPPKPSQHRIAAPATIDDVVARGMAKDPAQRFPTAGALAAAARKALDGSVTLPAGVLRPEPPRPAPPRPQPAPTDRTVAPGDDTVIPEVPASPDAPGPLVSDHAMLLDRAALLEQARRRGPRPAPPPPRPATPRPATPRPVTGPGRPSPAWSPAEGRTVPGATAPPRGATARPRPAPPAPRRRAALVVAGAVLAAVAVVAGVVLLRPTTTAPPAVELTLPQQSLLAVLPIGFSAANCAPAPEREDAVVDAALACTGGPANGPDTATFLHYRDSGALSSVHASDATARGLSTGDITGCRTGTATTGGWIRNAENGALSCWSEPAVGATIDWTDPRNRARALVVRADGDTAVLYDWWSLGGFL